jgi:1-acyl-sn-glycerol-3-phosphate acyltransferase
MVLIFPEGTRTRDGEVAAFKPGFSALAGRTAVSLVPLAIEGAFEAWPRRQLLPVLATFHIQFGEPILPEQVGAFDERQLVAEIENRIRACHLDARRKRSRAEGLGP